MGSGGRGLGTIRAATGVGMRGVGTGVTVLMTSGGAGFSDSGDGVISIVSGTKASTGLGGCEAIQATMAARTTNSKPKAEPNACHG